LRALWPGEGGLPDAGACPLCGGPCSAELQVLSPMWHYMEEVASWHSEYRPTSRAPETSIFQHKDWDWASVVVQTCDNSCHVGDESWCVAQERVVAFNFAHHVKSRGALTSLNSACLDDDDVVDCGKEELISVGSGREE
jgi:hypothetical protein